MQIVGYLFVCHPIVKLDSVLGKRLLYMTYPQARILM